MKRHRQLTPPPSLGSCEAYCSSRRSSAARSECPGPRQPTRPPTAPEAHPLARGCPLGPRGVERPSPHRLGAGGGALVPAHCRRFRCALAHQVSGRGRGRACQATGGAAGVGLRAGSPPSLYGTLQRGGG
eukprot:scaffold32079_cov82-Phaeocystis_antarctica.AAC.1